MRVKSHHLENRLLGLCLEIRSFNQGKDCYIAVDEDIGDILKDAKERRQFYRIKDGGGSGHLPPPPPH